MSEKKRGPEPRMREADIKAEIIKIDAEIENLTSQVENMEPGLTTAHTHGLKWGNDLSGIRKSIELLEARKRKLQLELPKAERRPIFE